MQTSDSFMFVLCFITIGILSLVSGANTSGNLRWLCRGNRKSVGTKAMRPLGTSTELVLEKLAENVQSRVKRKIFDDFTIGRFPRRRR